MLPRPPEPNSARRPRRAFTLVELLVVIGIIALLISILLPVLGRAREAANGVKCLSNMRTAAQAMLVYATENRNWLAGPHTSGNGWNFTPNIDNKSYGLDSVGAPERHSDETPIQNMDWMSPTLGKILTLPEQDVRRMRQLYEVDLYCPSNDVNFFSPPFANDEGVIWNSDLYRSQSYAAVIQFHAFPKRDDSDGDGGYDTSKGDRVGISAYNTSQSSYAGVRPPRDYAPTLTKIGRTAEKVYLVEGARHVDLDYSNPADPALAGLSMNFARYQRQGGNYMASGPYYGADNEPFALHQPNPKATPRLTTVARRMAWRHRGRMNLAFFDGHVESRDVGSSIQVGLYLPKGTVVANSDTTYDPTDSDGQVVN